jgi:hypothetical protein
MVTAISMVKDEADIVEDSMRRMAGQVDHLIVADNRSSDGTREILEQLASELPLMVLDDHEVGYFQSEKMTGLAEIARTDGADWVVPFDCDEAWLARTSGRVADALEALPAHVLVAEADLYDHVPTAEDPPGSPFSAIQWRRPGPGALPKVACRPMIGLTIHQGNHGASYEHNDRPLTVKNVLTVRHFPYRSVAQMVTKARNGAAAYAATDLPEETGGHWRGYGRALALHGEQGISDIFYRWFHREHPDEPLIVGDELQPPLVFDPLPPPTSP